MVYVAQLECLPFIIIWVRDYRVSENRSRWEGSGVFAVLSFRFKWFSQDLELSSFSGNFGPINQVFYL